MCNWDVLLAWHTVKILILYVFSFYFCSSVLKVIVIMNICETRLKKKTSHFKQERFSNRT